MKRSRRETCPSIALAVLSSELEAAATACPAKEHCVQHSTVSASFCIVCLQLSMGHPETVSDDNEQLLSQARAVPMSPYMCGNDFCRGHASQQNELAGQSIKSQSNQILRYEISKSCTFQDSAPFNPSLPGIESPPPSCLGSCPRY